MKEMFKTNPYYSVQKVSGTTVIIPISEKCPSFNGMMKLEGIGPFLWDVFSNGASIETACQKVLDKYDVSFEKANEDICKFVQSLLDHGLISEIK